MSTRFYFPRTGSPPFSYALGDWDLAGTVQGRPISTSKGSDAAAADNSADFTEVSASAQEVAHYQGVSEPLAAQTISGTFSAAFRGGVSSGLADAHLQIVIRVIKADQSDVRGVLYSGYAGALSATGIGREFSTSTTTTVVAGEALTPVAVEAGDYLVIEVGQRFTNTSTTATCPPARSAST